jgi:hypothetical protein
MPEIDFLPASYRQMTVHRKANVWRLLAGGIFVALIGFSAIYQHVLRREALAELAKTGPLYDQADALVQGHAELKRQLQFANDDAELYTYVRHPWPATQVLAAALAPLPDCITLSQIRLFKDQAPPSPAAATRIAPPQNKPAESEPAAKRELRQLRQDNDDRPRVLILSGITTDSAALQQYLLVLGKSELFVKTELGSLEADTADRVGAMHFIARLVIRPGYGQPGGPAMTNTESRTSKRTTNVE